MVPRWLIRPVVPAVLIWGLGLLALFLVIDLSVMPAFAGKFRETIAVPSVVGFEVERAEDTLRAHGLRVSVDTLTDYSSTIRRGHVLTQRPDSGSVVKEGRRVWLTLSRGRAGGSSARGR